MVEAPSHPSPHRGDRFLRDGPDPHLEPSGRAKLSRTSLPRAPSDQANSRSRTGFVRERR